MLTASVRANQHPFLPSWLHAGAVGQLWLALRWAVTVASAIIVLLTMLSLLPCISYCTRDETTSASSSGGFLCDRLFTLELRSLPEPPATHHHHTAPRGTFEPMIVQMGLMTPLVILVGCLFVGASLMALRPTSAPPTPPPRAA